MALARVVTSATTSGSSVGIGTGKAWSGVASGMENLAFYFIVSSGATHVLHGRQNHSVVNHISASACIWVDVVRLGVFSVSPRGYPIGTRDHSPDVLRSPSIGEKFTLLGCTPSYPLDGSAVVRHLNVRLTGY